MYYITLGNILKMQHSHKHGDVMKDANKLLINLCNFTFLHFKIFIFHLLYQQLLYHSFIENRIPKNLGDSKQPHRFVYNYYITLGSQHFYVIITNYHEEK